MLLLCQLLCGKSNLCYYSFKGMWRSHQKVGLGYKTILIIMKILP